MKSYTGIYRISLVLSLAFLLGLFTICAVNSKTRGVMANTALAQEQPSPPANDAASPGEDKKKEEFYPGRNLKDEAAVKKASLIIVGKIVDPGGRSFDFPGKTHYGQVKVDVLQVLKGYVSEAVSLEFEVYDSSASKDIAEKAPEVGRQYIIFINEKAVNNAIKFLPDTEDQRWHITELISSAANKEH